MMYRSTIGF